ncbi:MAG TPA: DoxX-like family protein [Accumulibacter sp.]|nr:DoxX-like family protein [Accumulibacter sp.]HQC78977.1 DoxX-like family protein [Accumulibacter sp.]
MFSAGLHPIDDSPTRLAAFHLAGIPVLIVLAAAILLDALFGLAGLFKPGARPWQAQLVLIISYSVLVAWRLPDYVSDPFGPILKNLAVIALLFQIWAEEEKQ